MLRKLLPAALLAAALSAAVHAAGPSGPGPVPSPWIVNGNAIAYPGSVVDTFAVPGGPKGSGTYNVSGGYYVNGVKVSGLPSIAQGHLICNLASGSAVPSDCSWNQFASLAIGTTANSMPFYTGSVWSTITTGSSVANPGTGKLEALLAPQTVTGTSKTFATADLFLETRRSNSGTAMTDTLPPAAATGVVNGARVVLTNVDATASDTLSPGAGTSIEGTGVVGPGRALLYIYDLPNTTWRPALNTGSDLLSANNLSDVASIATARANLIPSGTITNSQLANPSTSVNGVSCSLGGTCTIIPIVNNSVVSISGSGVIQSSATLPAGINLSTALGTSLALGGATLGSNTLAVTGTINLSGLTASGTCANSLAVTSAGLVFTAACPGATTSVQQGVTTVTSAGGSNQLLTTGTVSAGTGTLTNISVTGPLQVAAGALSLNATTTAHTIPIWQTTGALTNVPVGTLGQFVASGGAGVDPSMQSGPWTLLATLTASNSASLSDTTHVTSSYSDYEIVFENVLPATSATTCEILLHSNGSFQSSSYSVSSLAWFNTTVSSSSATAFVPCGFGGAVSNTIPINGSLRLYSPSQTATPKVVHSEFAGISSGTAPYGVKSSGAWNGGNTSIDGFEVLMASGNITSGTIKIYGRL